MLQPAQDFQDRRHDRRLHSARDLLGPLFAPLDFLLASGGDSRLAVDPDTGLNGYGCRPYPRPEAFTFSSSTATSISERAYACADKARQALVAAMIAGEGAFDARIESMRMRLLAQLALAGTGTEIVFSPSGTDAQLQALCLTRVLKPGPLTCIVVAANETGSGTGFAVTGRHFNDRTAQGQNVIKGERLRGMGGDVSRIDVSSYEANGQRRSREEMDDAVIAAVAKAVQCGRKVLLQAMDSSKLGCRAPSQHALHEIESRWPDAVQIVVDACQMRLSRERLRACLLRGHMVLVTGSKFFTGPPFSGALLVPACLSARLSDAVAIPSGLSDYTNRNDWPTRWQAIRAQLPDRHNAGQWLRWEAALAEIEAYFTVPQSCRSDALARFGAAVTRTIQGGGLALLDEPMRDDSDPVSDAEFEARTIFSFVVNHGGYALPYDAVAGIYRALNCDISDHLPPHATANEKRTAALLCHIGQPVPLRDAEDGTTAALRISAGARIVSERRRNDSAETQRLLDGECEQVRCIVEKIALLLRYQIAL